ASDQLALVMAANDVHPPHSPSAAGPANDTRPLHSRFAAGPANDSRPPHSSFAAGQTDFYSAAGSSLSPLSEPSLNQSANYDMAIPNQFDVLETRARMILMALESHLQNVILLIASAPILPEDCHALAYDPHGAGHSPTLPTVHCVVISNLGLPMFSFSDIDSTDTLTRLSTVHRNVVDIQENLKHVAANTVPGKFDTLERVLINIQAILRWFIGVGLSHASRQPPAGSPAPNQTQLAADSQPPAGSQPPSQSQAPSGSQYPAENQPSASQAPHHSQPPVAHAPDCSQAPHHSQPFAIHPPNCSQAPPHSQPPPVDAPNCSQPSTGSHSTDGSQSPTEDQPPASSAGNPKELPRTRRESPVPPPQNSDATEWSPNHQSAQVPCAQSLMLFSQQLNTAVFNSATQVLFKFSNAFRGLNPYERELVLSASNLGPGTYKDAIAGLVLFERQTATEVMNRMGHMQLVSDRKEFERQVQQLLQSSKPYRHLQQAVSTLRASKL
ncbi:hypothetical protein PCANC_25159, partial [Puccinia coronata f. sp. avenae]